MDEDRSSAGRQRGSVSLPRLWPSSDAAAAVQFIPAALRDAEATRAELRTCASVHMLIRRSAAATGVQVGIRPVGRHRLPRLCCDPARAWRMLLRVPVHLLRASWAFQGCRRSMAGITRLFQARDLTVWPGQLPRSPTTATVVLRVRVSPRPTPARHEVFLANSTHHPLLHPAHFPACARPRADAVTLTSGSTFAGFRIDAIAGEGGPVATPGRDDPGPRRTPRSASSSTRPQASACHARLARTPGGSRSRWRASHQPPAAPRTRFRSPPGCRARRPGRSCSG